MTLRQNKEIYISIDIEADGPIPGPHSMLSLGAAAYTVDGNLQSTFSVNFKKLPNAHGHPDTMKWWETQKEAWKAHRQNIVEPEQGMYAFIDWAKKQGKSSNLVCVAYPAGFDWTFVYWYLMNFVGKSPFSFSCLDVKTLAMSVIDDVGYREASKRRMPKHWFPKNLPHTHVAVDDAIEQGALFCNILKDVKTSRALFCKKEKA